MYAPPGKVITICKSFLHPTYPRQIFGSGKLWQFASEEEEEEDSWLSKVQRVVTVLVLRSAGPHLSLPFVSYREIPSVF